MPQINNPAEVERDLGGPRLRKVVTLPPPVQPVDILAVCKYLHDYRLFCDRKTSSKRRRQSAMGECVQKNASGQRLVGRSWSARLGPAQLHGSGLGQKSKG